MIVQRLDRFRARHEGAVTSNVPRWNEEGLDLGRDKAFSTFDFSSLDASALKTMGDWLVVSDLLEISEIRIHSTGAVYWWKAMVEY